MRFCPPNRWPCRSVWRPRCQALAKGWRPERRRARGAGPASRGRCKIRFRTRPARAKWPESGASKRRGWRAVGRTSSKKAAVWRSKLTRAKGDQGSWTYLGSRNFVSKDSKGVCRTRVGGFWRGAIVAVAPIRARRAAISAPGPQYAARG